MELQRFVELALTRTGGVAQVSGDCVEALLAPAAAAALEVPEDARLRTAGEPRSGEVTAGYGSRALARLCELVASAPRTYRLELEAPLPKRERIEREAEAARAFRNATARVESIEDAVLEYTLVNFRYAATADEKSEGLVAVAISAAGTSSPRLAADLAGFLERHQARREWCGITAVSETWPLEARLEAAQRAARTVVRDETRPFVARMERRLQRDLRRVHDYYGALRGEVESRRRRSRDVPEALAAKVAAVEAEQHHREQDLRRRYAVTLHLEPVAVLAVRIRGAAVTLRVQRKKDAATRRLGWNGVARELDHWICAACGAEVLAPSVCEAFHFVCAECPARCATCSREACPACSPACRCSPGGNSHGSQSAGP